STPPTCSGSYLAALMTFSPRSSTTRPFRSAMKRWSGDSSNVAALAGRAPEMGAGPAGRGAPATRSGAAARGRVGPPPASAKASRPATASVAAHRRASPRTALRVDPYGEGGAEGLPGLGLRAPVRHQAVRRRGHGLDGHEGLAGRCVHL